MNRRLFILGMTVLTLALTSHDASAQRSTRSTADRRQHPGKGFWSNQSASRRIGHALDYSRGLSDYARRAQVVDRDFAKSQVEEIGRNISVAEQQLMTVRKDAEQTGDKTTVADIDRISKALKAAQSAHADCVKHCEQANLDTTKLDKSAAKVTKSLEDAASTHKQMMERLHPEATKNPAPKDEQK